MESYFYLYAFAKADTQKAIEVKGLFGQAIESFVEAEVAVYFSQYPEEQPKTVVNSRENLLTHQRAVEAIFEHQTTLPIKFGTLMTKTEMIDFLQSQAITLNEYLKNLNGKVEMVFKGFWKDMPSIFNEISENNENISNFKQQIASGQIPATQNNLIEIGKMVEDALQNKKDDLKNTILEKLIPLSIEIKENQLLTDSMFLNVVFLIEKSQEKNFDELVQAITDELEANAKFQYFGPAAPANFIDLKFED